MTGFIHPWVGLVLLGSLVVSPGLAQAQAADDHDHGKPYEHFYVGLDNRPTITTGTYAGLTNPNFGRLTYLFAHTATPPTTNHFHGIGAYSYSGTAASPTIVSTSTNNRIPEPYSLIPPLVLSSGSGVFADRLISQEQDGVEYSNLLLKPMNSLLSYSDDPGAGYLFNSSDNRWSSTLGDAIVGLELVSTTAGLSVANAQGQTILSQAGDTYRLGQGDNFEFLPTFATDRDARPGNYSASFRLRDLNTSPGYVSRLNSGTFSVDFAVVPEPGTLIGLGLVGLGAWRSRRRSKLAAA
jgi:hypothetical protein